MRKRQKTPPQAKKGGSVGRHAFWPIETMSPTPERVAKPDFEKDHHGLFARARTVQSLHSAREISGDAVTAASWWLSDFVFAREGYGDWLRDLAPDGYLQGDVHTFAFQRGQAGARISRIRARLTEPAHELLVMLLADGLSFTAIAKLKYPCKHFEQGKRLVRGQAAIVLEQLAGYYAGRESVENKGVDNGTDF